MTALHAHHRHNAELSHRKAGPWTLVDGVLTRVDVINGTPITSRIENNPGNLRCPFKYSVGDKAGLADCVMYAKNRVSILLKRLGAKS